jgi:beta-glucanase (GH16 family)
MAEVTPVVDDPVALPSRVDRLSTRRPRWSWLIAGLCGAVACDRPATSGTHPDPIPPEQPEQPGPGAGAPNTLPQQPLPQQPLPQQPLPQQPSSDHHPAGYQLVFADEFGGHALDRRQWCTRYVYAGGPPLQLNDYECTRDAKGTLDFLNDEAQRYRDMDSTGKLLHQVGGGALTLVAVKGTGSAKYEAAMIRSKQLFKPDDTKSLYITARVRLPSVKGTWPAFWLNSDRDDEGNVTWPPEIDIFEAPLNGVEDKETMLKVGAVTRDKSKRRMSYTHGSFNERWRNYHATSSIRDKWVETAVEWTKDSVCYYFDGTKLMCEDYRWVHEDGRPAPPAHILLNIAVGGEWAGRHGIDDAKFPAKFSIDYVRVYERPALR